MQSVSAELADSIASKLKTDLRYLIESTFYILDKDSRLSPLILNPVQNLYWPKITPRDIILKSRKMGFTTIRLARMVAKCATMQYRRAVLVSHEDEATKRILGRATEMVKNCVINLGAKPTENTISFPNTKSSLYIGTAGAKAFGRGDDITDYHCLHPDTLVIGKDGYPTKISDITDGSAIITHGGIRASSSGAIKNEINGRKMVSVSVVGNSTDPIICTEDHKLYACYMPWSTKRKAGQWIEAGKLIPGVHYLGIPRRRYKSKNFYWEFKGTKRWPGKISPGMRLKMDFGLGYLWGIYIAEGTIIRNGKCPSGITLSLDRDEIWIVDEVRKLGIGEWHVRKFKNSRTMTASLYHSSLSRAIADTLGCTTNKHIPDMVFRANRGFLDGLVKGYLDGDGHISKDGSCISAVSICPQVIVQMRDLISALGLGHCSINRLPAGMHYKRNCKESWRLYANGVANFRIRKKFGWPIKKMRAPAKRWKQDLFYTWVPVGSVSESDYSGPVYDISVKHQDHSYRTLSATVHNCTEFAWWQKPDLITGIEEGCVKDSEGCIESTAHGYGNPFHNLWVRASRREAGINLSDGAPRMYAPHFFGWWQDPTLEVDCPKPLEDLNEYERMLRQELGVSDRKLLWRRLKIESMFDPTLFPQEYPATPEEAFLVSGSMIFDALALAKHEKNARPVLWRGDIMDKGDRVGLEPSDRGRLSIYRTPTGPGQYIITADVAAGVSDGCYSVADVWDLANNEQVAQWRGHIAPELFGDVLCLLGAYYNYAQLVPEVNNHGLTTCIRIQDNQYPNLYRREKDKGGTTLGFFTSPGRQGTKIELINSARAAVREFTFKLNSVQTISEMRTFVTQENGDMDHMPGAFSDCVITAGIGAMMLAQAQYVPEDTHRADRIIKGRVTSRVNIPKFRTGYQ